MKNIISLTGKEIADALEDNGLKPFRAKQIFQFIHFKGVQNFKKMTNIGKLTEEFLEKTFRFERPSIIETQESPDGTRKWLLKLSDGALIETVYIPEADRGAVCLSTQVGCPNACAFCRTGSQGLVRNLTADEIIGQLMVAKDAYNEWNLAPLQKRKISNIVMMGMGEPLYNMENVERAIDIFTDECGISISKRRITVSTSGVAPMIPKLATRGVKLALSLHATTDETRNEIMPVNRKYPIAEVMKAVGTYQKITGRRNAITIEYTLMKDINDGKEDAKRLIALTKGLTVKFNLIPMNEWEGCGIKATPRETVKKFAEFLTELGYIAPIRISRGQEIKAACGQLKTETLKKA